MLSKFVVCTRTGLVLYEYNSEMSVVGDPVNALMAELLAPARAVERGGNSDGTFATKDDTLRYVLDNARGLLFVAVFASTFRTKVPYVETLLHKTRERVAAVLDENNPVARDDPAALGDRFHDQFVDDMEAAEMQHIQERKNRAGAPSKGRATSTVDDHAKSPLASPHSTTNATPDTPSAAAATPQSAPASPAVKLTPKQILQQKRREQAQQRRTSEEPSPSSSRTSRIKPIEREPKSVIVGEGTSTKEYLDPNAKVSHSGDVEDLEYTPSQSDVSKSSAKKSSGWGVFEYIQKTLRLGGEITEEDLGPVMEKTKESLMGKNVAAEIAEALCKSVSASLVGKQAPTLTSVQTTVRDAVSECLTRILSPSKRVDILRGIIAAREQKRPYVIVFCGVNGVGKSTNLAKIAYWLTNKKQRVLIAACDTFRSGAVEQLMTHKNSLNKIVGFDNASADPDAAPVALYESGYGKNAADVAKDAIVHARQTGRDVVLVDTAGRMQDNEPLMRSLAKLVGMNSPDLVLFVGEALVGNEAVDQLSKFSRALSTYGSSSAAPRLIDGIVLTKFDTIDDKVGAAISMTYTSGKPIVFVGTGQTYDALRNFNVKTVVDALMQ